jgi:DNA-binding MarR family transcriptional regulator
LDRFEQDARDRLGGWPDLDLNVFAASFLLFRLSTLYPSHLESRVHRPQGLSTAGFRVLFTVWVYDELEPRQIAKLSGVSTAAVSGVLTTLVSKGLVGKRRDAADRRLVRVRLTKSGEALLVDTYEMQNLDEERIFGDIEPADLHTLTLTLRNLLSKMSA